MVISILIILINNFSYNFIGIYCSFVQSSDQVVLYFCCLLHCETPWNEFGIESVQFELNKWKLKMLRRNFVLIADDPPTSCTCNRMLDGFHRMLFACNDLSHFYLKPSEVGGFRWGSSSPAWISHKIIKFQNFVSPTKQYSKPQSMISYLENLL